MRFLVMHKNQPSAEAGLPPSKELIENMGAFMGEFFRTGRGLDGAGLLGSKTRTRLVFREGRCTVKHGPYTGEHELPSTIHVLKVKTREEAIGWAERYGKILGDGEIELGKVTEPWDIGVAPMPPNPPLHFLLVDKADAVTEGAGRSAKLKAELTRLRTEMTKAGVLQRGYHFAPSSKAKRLVFQKNDLRVIDGPFAESKELIGGFSIMELEDYDAVIAMARRYAEILGGTLEIDVRVVVDPD